jgi:hypothetical protein
MKKKEKSAITQHWLFRTTLKRIRFFFGNMKSRMNRTKENGRNQRRREEGRALAEKFGISKQTPRHAPLQQT